MTELLMLGVISGTCLMLALAVYIWEEWDRARSVIKWAESQQHKAHETPRPAGFDFLLWEDELKEKDSQ